MRRARRNGGKEVSGDLSQVEADGAHILLKAVLPARLSRLKDVFGGNLVRVGVVVGAGCWMSALSLNGGKDCCNV